MSIRQTLLAATLLAATASTAMAQPASVYNLQQLPVTQGKVMQYSLTPRGDVDGVILDNGVQAHLPPHLGRQLVKAVKPGDMVTIHGLKARVLPLVRAASITDEATHQTVEDHGPPPRPHALGGMRQWMKVQGKVREALYGPRGEINGALLENGTQIHLPPDRARALADDLQPGKILVAEGFGVAGPYGKSIGARRIGDEGQPLVRVGPPGPPHGPHGHRPPPPDAGAPPPPPPGR